MDITTRNADLNDLLQILRDQHARKIDTVVPATAIRAHKGQLVISGATPDITEEGVTMTDGRYNLSSVALEGIADKLSVPIKYLRRMYAERYDLFDATVNGWLRGGITPDTVIAHPDERSFLVRAFRGDDPTAPGFARAVLSDRYRMVDNIDVLMAALDGIRAAGVPVEIVGGDLTERKMRVRVKCEAISALAPTLLEGYRSPFTGQSGSDNPTVFAGLEIANSEVGGGAFTITPRLVVQVCNNGMTLTKDALRNVHLGGKMDAGVIRWSDETQQKNLDLVKSQTVDAVTTFLDTDYMTRTITQLEAKSATEVSTPDQVRNVTKPLGFTDDQIDDVMGFFIRGAQTTLGGVANAITAAAQEVADGDVAADMEERATALLLTA